MNEHYLENKFVKEMEARENEIKKILNSFTGLTAFQNQIDFMESIKEQFERTGYLSDKQIEVAKKIVQQNKDFSRMWRNTRISEG